MTLDGNSLGVKSLEGLEKGNYTTQVMDAHHTFKGDRKKANIGVFKLLRLKSNRLLRSYRKKPPTRVQRCSSCHRVGHNALSKLCSAGLIQEGDHVEDVHGDVFGGAAAHCEAAHGEAANGEADLGDAAHGEGLGEAALDESRQEDIEDLLNDSDNELY